MRTGAPANHLVLPLDRAGIARAELTDADLVRRSFPGTSASTWGERRVLRCAHPSAAAALEREFTGCYAARTHSLGSQT